jgi:hypothetical protein
LNPKGAIVRESDLFPTAYSVLDGLERTFEHCCGYRRLVVDDDEDDDDGWYLGGR